MEALEGRIAVIGWGSLIWDLDDLAPKVEGEWRMRAGPALPFEFSLVSRKRKMGLAVCLDPENGDECPTHVIASRRAEPEFPDNIVDNERSAGFRDAAFDQHAIGHLRHPAPVKRLDVSYKGSPTTFECEPIS